MRYLVTGGCGFIGSKLVASLAPDNEVHVYDINVRNTIENVSYLPPDKQYLNYASYDVIFHLGAVASIRSGFTDPIRSVETNIVETVRLLDEIKESGTKLVFISSCTVYCDKDSPYSISKKVGEQYCKMYQELFGTNISIARIGNAYGDPDTRGIVYRLINQRLNNQPLTITGDGTQTRDFIHVDDIVAGLIKISSLNGTFDLCSGTIYNINQLAEVLGGPIQYIPLPPCEGFKAWPVVPNIPDWEPQISITGYLKEKIASLV